MKQSIKKIVTLLMLVSILVTCFIVSASALQDTNKEYEFTASGSNATITKKLTTSNNALVFPDTVKYNGKTYTVTAINSLFFSNSKSKTQYATSVKLPTTLSTIAQATFNSDVSSLTYIEIPGANTTSSDYFMGCKNLTQFIVNENNPNLKAIDGVLFKVVSGETYLQRFPAAKRLDNGTTYEVPDGVTRLTTYAFYNAKHITDVKVPASVTAIRGGVFCESNITGVHLENGTNFDPSTYQCYCAANSTKKCADRLEWCIEDEQEGYDPVCGTPGHTAGLRCDITGEWLTGEEIPAVGEHQWALTGTTESTCTEDIVRSFKCGACGETKEEVLIDSALGHIGGTATCKELAVCERCNQPYGKVDLNNHSFTDYSIVISEATCKSDKIIGAICDYGCTRVNNKAVEGTKLPHGETTTSQTKMPANCTEDGYLYEVVKCKKCSTVLDETTTVLPALGHTETKPVISDEIAATCEEDGSYVSTVYCERCDFAAAETVVVPALGHAETKPVISDEIAATCEEDGSYVSTVYCERCDFAAAETVVVPALGHKKTDPVKENEIAPDCTKAGSYTLTVYCERCDFADVETITVPALGHTDNDGDYICDNDGEALRSPADDCEHMCHKEGFMGFIWKVIRFFQKLFKMNPVCDCGVAHY